MAEERVLSILREAGASEEELGQVRRVLDLWRRGVIGAEDAYFFIVGLARERFIPLTPRQVSEIRVALGLPRE